MRKSGSNAERARLIAAVLCESPDSTTTVISPAASSKGWIEEGLVALIAVSFHLVIEPGRHCGSEVHPRKILAKVSRSRTSRRIPGRLKMGATPRTNKGKLTTSGECGDSKGSSVMTKSAW